MAYAGLANLSPIFGLYCAIVPAFTYAAFGPSRESAIGAMALVSIMVGQAVADLTPDNAPLPARVAVAVKLAFLTGLLQMGMGLLKMGEVASLVSHPVMQGFSSGGEILIAVSQVKWIFGVRIPPQRYAWQTLYYLCAHIRETEPWTLLLGVVTCGLLFALSKWRRLTKARMEVRAGVGGGSVQPVMTWIVCQSCCGRQAFNCTRPPPPPPPPPPPHTRRKAGRRP